MKKLLLLLCLAVAFTSCKDDKEENDTPDYMSWTEGYLIGGEGSTFVYYRTDTVVVVWKVYEEQVYKYDVVFNFSTHNHIFEGIEPSGMTDTQLKNFGYKWIEEIKKEPRRDNWCFIMSWLEKDSKGNASKTIRDYGLLWGLKPDAISRELALFNINRQTVTMTFGDVKLRYDFEGGNTVVIAESLTITKGNETIFNKDF